MLSPRHVSVNVITPSSGWYQMRSLLRLYNFNIKLSFCSFTLPYFYRPIVALLSMLIKMHQSLL